MSSEEYSADLINRKRKCISEKNTEINILLKEKGEIRYYTTMTELPTKKRGKCRKTALRKFGCEEKEKRILEEILQNL